MKDHPQRHYILGECFAIEQSSEIKHEFYEGEIFTKAGASVLDTSLSLGEVHSRVFADRA